MPGYRISVRKGGGAQLPALVTILSLAATATVVSILFWRLHYEAGFSWSEEPSNQFSWHPLLMSLCIILMGFGSIIYRITPWITRKTSKAIHALLMLLSLGAGVPGIWAVWESHSLASPPIPHMFSLHSWLGLTTLGLVASQLLLGVSIFLFPCAPSRLRGQYHQLHVFFGLAFLILASATSVVGLTEEALFSLASNYPLLPGKGVLLNLIGIFLTVFTITVTFIATKSSFKPLN